MTWIDFKTLRKGLSFEAVLKFYGVGIKRKAPGNRHQGFSPLPTHQGKRRSPSFSAKLDVGVWQCFGCRASGSVLDFAVRMEGKDPRDMQAFRAVALKLQQHFAVHQGEPRPSTAAHPRKASDESQRTIEKSVIVNPPLDFELKGLDFDHPYLRDRGFAEETIRHFGFGYCNRGLMKGRIVIPLHDQQGKLIGYAGRLVNDAEISAERPKYLLPGRRERDGKVIAFQKSLFLYNGFQITKPSAKLIVVEGFASVWWLWQHGLHDVVAVMGNSCSDEQANLIVVTTAIDGCVWIVPDGDAAGEALAAGALPLIGDRRFVRWARLPPDESPTTLDGSALMGLIR